MHHIFSRLLVCGLLSPASALAVGLCEGLVDTAQVVSISESMGLVAVRRAVETCQETAAGTERRQLTRVVELRDLDTGKVKRRFVAEPKASREPLVRQFGAAVGDWAAYTGMLKEGLFQVLPAAPKNPFCSVSLSIEAGGLVAIVDGRDVRDGKVRPLRATVRLLDAVSPTSPAAQMARVWFVRNGSGLVFDIEAPVPADRKGVGHHSAVRIVPMSEAPVLRGCATPRPARPTLP